ncbi:MAG: HD domain-containing protein [Anaerolineae bacterium]|nr:HD domain-containing protein [Anaerolineae bacterium]
MPIRVPTRHNLKLRQVVERINADAELHQLWKCANINAVDRMRMSDHGEVHIRIVSNVALKMLRLLVRAGVEMSVVANHGLTTDDAEVIVVLASCLHDVGMAVHRERHEDYSVPLALSRLHEWLPGIYPRAEAAIVTAEVLHAVVAHNVEVPCLTVEAGIVKVADALDMCEGRSRIPFEAGALNIHAVSAAAIEGIRLMPGATKPIRVEVVMNNSAGIFQLDELLRRKLRSSSIAPYVQVVAAIETDTERHLVAEYEL